MDLDNGFSTQIASDVGERDGLGLELLDKSTGGEVWAEVFRDDSDNTLLVRLCTDRPLPFEVMRQWVARRREPLALHAWQGRGAGALTSRSAVAIRAA